MRVNVATILRITGGLLIAMSLESAQNFLEKFKGVTGKDAWIIGEFLRGNRKVKVMDDAEVVEVPCHVD